MARLLGRQPRDRDDRENKSVVKSRIGLESEAIAFPKHQNLVRLFNKYNKKEDYGVVIVEDNFGEKWNIENLSLDKKLRVLRDMYHTM